MIDIHALQIFYEASRTGNFTAAARLLNLSQPAVSMQIKSLEDYLQVKLFEREGRSMRLTKAGQALVPMAQQILDLAASAEEAIRASDGQVVGNLVIGCSATSANYVLPHLIARFQSLYPNVRVSMPIVSQDELHEKLSRGLYDFGVMSAAAACDEISCVPFFEDRVVLIAGAVHPFTAAPSIEPKQLLNERFICQDRHSACRQVVGNALDPFGVDINQLHISMEMGSPEAIVMAVEHGLGLSFVSMLAAAPRLALGRLAIIPLADLRLQTRVFLGTPKIHNGSVVQSKFRNFIKHPQTRSLIGLLTEGRLT